MRWPRFFHLCGLAAALLLTLLLAACATPAAPAASTPKLTPNVLPYADEFAGSNLDGGTWATLTPWRTRYTTGDLQTYDPANVTVSGGKLHLLTEARSSAGRSYTSGIVTSLDREQFSYGYFETRAKLPRGKGVWPAFWLTNDATLEIDAFELLGDRPDRVYMTLHEHDRIVYQGVYDGPDFSAGYHTFGVDWQPTYVRWYVDGVQRAKYVGAIPSARLWVCLNTAVGGEWAGPPDATTSLPQSFDIDYVRVFERMPTASQAATRGVPAISTQ